MGSEENLILCQSEMHDETNQECTVNIKMSDFHTLLMSHAVCSSPRCLAFLSSTSVQCLRNDRSEHSSADEYKYDFLRLDLLINRFDSKKQHLSYTGAHKCRSATYFSRLNIFFPTLDFLCSQLMALKREPTTPITNVHIGQHPGRVQ